MATTSAWTGEESGLPSTSPWPPCVPRGRRHPPTWGRGKARTDAAPPNLLCVHVSPRRIISDANVHVRGNGRTPSPFRVDRCSQPVQRSVGFFGLRVCSEGAPTWPLMSGRAPGPGARGPGRWAGEESRGRANWGALIKWRHTKRHGASCQQLSIHPVSEEFIHLNESMHCQRGPRATKGGCVWPRGLGHTGQKLC